MQNSEPLDIDLTAHDEDMMFYYLANEDKIDDRQLGEYEEVKERAQEQLLQELDEEEFQKQYLQDRPPPEQQYIHHNTIRPSANLFSPSVKSMPREPSRGRKRSRTPFAHQAPPPAHVPPPNPIQTAQPHVYGETPAQRRKRQREAYVKLRYLKEHHGIRLTREYDRNDDPEEMEEEYNLQYAYYNKTTKVQNYQKNLCNALSFIEMLNDSKLNPFDFHLKDWSMHVRQHPEEFHDVIADLYEKYKDKTSNIAPEIRLVGLILMSGFSYHMMKSKFGENGMENVLKNNPLAADKLKEQFQEHAHHNMPIPATDDDILAQLNANANKYTAPTPVPATYKGYVPENAPIRMKISPMPSMSLSDSKSISPSNTPVKSVHKSTVKKPVRRSVTPPKTAPVPTTKSNHTVLSNSTIKPRFESNPRINQEHSPCDLFDCPDLVVKNSDESLSSLSDEESDSLNIDDVLKVVSLQASVSPSVMMNKRSKQASEMMSLDPTRKGRTTIVL